MGKSLSIYINFRYEFDNALKTMTSRLAKISNLNKTELEIFKNSEKGK